MKLIRTLLVATLLTAGLAACADEYDGPGPYGAGDYGYHYHDDEHWRGGHECSGPDGPYPCDPY